MRQTSVIALLMSLSLTIAPLDQTLAQGRNAHDPERPAVTKGLEEGESPDPPLPELLSELAKDRLEERMEWLNRQRVYPFKNIPIAAYEDASRVYIHAREEVLKRWLGSHANGAFAPDGPLPTSSWTEIGPGPISPSGMPFGSVTGRISAVALHPTDANIILIGSSRGGIWRSANNGTTWTPVSDNQATLVIADIKFAPSNPNIVYAATGDDDISTTTTSGLMRQSGGAWGAGVLKSTNAGLTWARIDNGTTANGIPPGTILSKIVVDPTDPDKVVAAGWVEQETGGNVSATWIFRSANGGTTWSTATLPGPLNVSNFRSLAIEPNCPMNLWAVNWRDHKIDRSVDGGANWTEVATAGLPGFLNNTQLAVQSTGCGGPRVLYASVHSYDGIGGTGMLCSSGNNANGPCAVNNDCPGNCVGGTAPGQNCRLNPDCPGAGATCQNQGTCRQTCALGPNNGQTCTATASGGAGTCGGGSCGAYTCVGGTTPGTTCFADIHCGGGGKCGFVCRFGTNDGTPCLLNATCMGGGVCGSLRCVGGPDDGRACSSTCGNGTCGKICIGGTLAGAACSADAQCAGGGSCSTFYPGVYRSANDGANWAATPGPAGGCLAQCSYDHALLVDPGDAARVYMVGRDIWTSTDSGGTWMNRSGGFDNANGYTFGKLHVDLHELAIRGAGGAAVIYIAGDGGLWSYDVGANTFTNRNGNLAISEFIDLAIDPDTPNQAIAGLQDNGTIGFTGSSVWPGRLAADGGASGWARATAGASPPPYDGSFTTYVQNTGFRSTASSGTFATCLGGQTPGVDCVGNSPACNTLACADGTNDGTPCVTSLDCTGGGTCEPGFCTPYTCTDGTNNGTPCSKHSQCTGGGVCRVWASDADFSNESAEFYGPWIATPGDNRVWHGAQSIWFCAFPDDCHPWTKLAGSDNLTGGAGYLSKMAIHNPSAGVRGPFYVSAFDAPRFFQSDTGGTWNDRTAGLPDRYITRIVFDPDAPQKVWVTVSGFGSGHVWYSGNGGRTWLDRSGNLPNVPANTIFLDPENRENVWYIGTDIGVWGTVNAGVNWQVAGSNLPAVMVADLDIDQNRTLYAATGGRSVWKITLPSTSPVREKEPNGSIGEATALGGTKVVALGDILPDGDVDYYSFGATTDTRVYAATMTEFDPSSPDRGDSLLELFRSNGTTLIEMDDDDGEFNAKASSIAGATIPSTGTYYLRVKHANPSRQIRPYTLYLRTQSGSPAAEVEPNDSNATATALPANGWVSGTHGAATDTDYFKFTVNAGETVFLSLDADPERDGTTWNPRLGLDSFGDVPRLIPTVDDGNTTSPNSEALFLTVKDAGTYYAYVNTTAQTSGGPSQTYHLSVSTYPFAPATTTCATYTSTDVPKAIPAGPGLVNSTITIPGSPRIADLDVSIQLTHALMQDLDVHLLSPAGNNDGLFTDVGNGNAGDAQVSMDLRLDDEAASPPTYTAMKGLVLQPERDYRLSWFDGENAGGTWTLAIRDDQAGNAGNLTGWSLTVCEPPAICPAGTVAKNLFATDFETDDGNFVHGGAQDEWARGNPTSVPVTGCNSGTKCWKTDLTGTYNANSNQDLTSPEIDLTNVPAPIRVTWAQKYQMENASNDHAYVDVDLSAGGNPTRLFEHTSGTMTDPVGNPVVTINESSGWSVMTADISQYVDKKVKLKFHVDSDGANNYAGLAIDDVKVVRCCPAGSLAGLAFAPFTLTLPTKTSLSWTSFADATAYDIVRRRINAPTFDGNFALFTAAQCGVTGFTYDITSVGNPPPGSADLWCIRGKGTCAGSETWNEGGNQAGDRDTGLAFLCGPTTCTGGLYPGATCSSPSDCPGGCTNRASNCLNNDDCPGGCSNDANILCLTAAACRFCNNDHHIPCTSPGDCISVGGICSASGTCNNPAPGACSSPAPGTCP